VDASQTFTLAGGTLTFYTINLMPHSTTPAKILMSGDVSFNSLSNAPATVANGSGSGSSSGFVDLGGGTRAFNVGDGAAEVDMSIAVPVSNGALSKTGLGTMTLSSANTYSGGTTGSAGRLLVNNTTGSGTGSGGTLGGTGAIAGVVTVNSGGTVSPGTASALGALTLNSVPTFNGTNFMRIDRNAGTSLADKLVLTSGTLNYNGGTLVVANAGATLTGGEVFTNFAAGAYSGAFAATNLPTLNSNLNWYLGHLATNGTIKVNRKPVVNGVTVANTPGQVLPIPIASLIGSATDADGDSLSLAGFDPVTAYGITLSADSTYIYYSNSANVADQFNYTISDGHGGNTTGLVQITNTVPNPPIISSGPDSLAVVAGQNATFTVSALGSQPLSYQWRFNDTNLDGATLSTYTRSGVQPADAGSYSVVVTNAYGSATSSVATLTVIVPPTIATQPLSQTVTQGTVATFSVAASGTAPFSYQWRLNGASIGGATASSYTRSNVQPADAGSYSVVVTNAAGGATSSNAVLTVIAPPAITTQPQGQTVVLGGTAAFSVVATGTAPLAYQWRLNGTNIGGATATGYARANLQATDAGDYSVLVSNAYGSVLSSNATLVVDTNVTLPVITSQPQSQTVIAGQSATFTVTATNKAAMSYQWQFNAAPIPEATGSVYTVANAQANNAGSYSVVITNIIGSTTSTDAVLTVNFSLAAAASTGGSVSKNPDQSSYTPNAVVTLTATANTDYLFNGWSGDAVGTNNPLTVTMTTNKSINATFASIETDFILDNTNPAVSFVGVWQAGTGSTDKYGPDYRFASTAVGGLSNAIYRPCISTPGYYDVYIWYEVGSNRATNAPWSVVYDGGSLNVSVNQQANGGAWVLIGTALPFVQGTNGYVLLSNNTGYSGSVVMADAVRFNYVGAFDTNITLTATASGGGAVYKNPDQTIYAPNSAVTLIAAPVLGWSFSGWSGSASGTANPLNVTLIHNVTITANFTSTVPDLIVDDPAATLIGTWTSRTATDDYGANYLRASTVFGTATATATFTPTIVTAGRYDV
jgi:uncharacterized repeat protein (TIGR02543 family)